MKKLSNKVLAMIAGIVVAGGAITATAAMSNMQNVAPKAESISSSASSEAISSDAQISSAVTVSSQAEVSNVADGVKEIQEATDSGVSAVNKAAQDGVKSVKEEGKVVITNVHYAVMNPSTGAIVYYGDSNYDKYKAQLGGDAGTVAPEQSKACQAAWNALKAKAETQSPTK